MNTTKLHRTDNPINESMRSSADAIASGLAELVRDVVRSELAPLCAPGEKPTLLTRAEIARELGSSVATIDRLCRDGLPFVRLGDVRRFELPHVLEWLRARDQEVRG